MSNLESAKLVIARVLLDEKPNGTAFAISPRVAVSAMHVVGDPQSPESVKLEFPDANGTFKKYEVRSATIVDSSLDLVLLFLKKPLPLEPDDFLEFGARPARDCYQAP